MLDHTKLETMTAFTVISNNNNTSNNCNNATPATATAAVDAEVAVNPAVEQKCEIKSDLTTTTTITTNTINTINTINTLNTTTNTFTSVKPTKAKTILNWLKSATSPTTATTTTTKSYDNTESIYVNVNRLSAEHLDSNEIISASANTSAIETSAEVTTSSTTSEEIAITSASASAGVAEVAGVTSGVGVACTCGTLETPSTVTAEETTQTKRATTAKTAAAAAAADKTSLISRGRTSANANADATLREFRGVQSLRHLWNKRISAHEESRFRTAFASAKVGSQKLTKSISCLVNAAAGGGGNGGIGGGSGSGSAGASHSSSNNNNTKAGSFFKKRAQSLHDCTRLDDDGEELRASHLRAEAASVAAKEAAAAAAAQEVAAEQEQRQFDLLLHREKDNFYKYKTAEQAAKHIAREARVRHSRASSAGRNHNLLGRSVAEPPDDLHSDNRDRNKFSCSSSSSDYHRTGEMAVHERPPAVAGESSSPSAALSAYDCDDHHDHGDYDVDANDDSHNHNQKTNKNNNNNNNNNNIGTSDVIGKKRCSAICQMQTSPNSSDNGDSQATTSPGDGSRTHTAQRETPKNATTATTKTKTGRAILESPIGHNSSGVVLRSGAEASGRSSGGGGGGGGSGGGTPRRTSSASSRKCSFKTHSRSYHHTPRKMLNSNKDGNGGGSGSGTPNANGGNGGGGRGLGGGGSVGVGFSRVAKLTQQFNELIQKDRKLLEEVKRKNGVLMARGGHIYKVVPTSDLANKMSARLSKDLTPSAASLATSHQSHQSPTSQSTVRRNIKKFETGAADVTLETTTTTATSSDVLLAKTMEKPKVPVKSVQVLRKRNEIVVKRQANGNASVIGASGNGSGSNGSTSAARLHMTLPQPSAMPLEAVKEESKTPIDNEERTIASTLAINAATTAAATTAAIVNNRQHRQQQQLNVSNALNTARTYAVLKDETLELAQIAANNSTKDDACNSKNTPTTESETEIATAKAIATEDAYAHIEKKGERTGATLTTIENDTTTESNDELPIMMSVSADRRATECEVDGGEVGGGVMNDGDAEVEVEGDGEGEGEGEGAKQKQRKSKYTKIYEKIRFRSPFKTASSKKASSSPEKTSTSSTAPQATVSELPTTTTTTVAKSLIATNDISEVVTNINEDADVDHVHVHDHERDHDVVRISEPEAAKLLNALEVVDRKLKGLSITTPDASLVLCENDDFEQRVLPNSSFVYQVASQAKQVCNNDLIVTQAVNVALVNSIEGEQMIMEQKELHCRHRTMDASVETLNEYVIRADSRELLPQADENERKPATKCRPDDEEIYEPIGAIRSSILQTELPPETNKETKTESTQLPAATAPAATTTPTPFIFKQCISKAKTDEIYQTVEETKTALSDYESIAGSSEHALELSRSIIAPGSYFDGYEICAPPTDEAPIQPITPPAPLAPPIMRNTNDELPELPKPKRRLPKSPLPCKRAQAKAETPIDLEVTLTTATVASHIELEEELDDEHHYYADDENIYDTIKGSHCYESVHSESIKLSNKSGGKSSDSVSLTSNGYESISHYRRLVVHQHQHQHQLQHPHLHQHQQHHHAHQPVCGGSVATGSSGGSTLTISSDHKTNSLYEVSLAAGLLYGSSLRGSRSASGVSNSSGSGSAVVEDAHVRAGSDVVVVAGNSISDDATNGCVSVGDGGSNHYAHSHIASSENSDEWIDISDAEADRQVTKQQFIVVRERFKVHRSPDWSKRVRDKRLQQKKAMSCIEDDSDHYYESLSPLSNKRHSTQLVQRSNSHHKRNQDLPRYVRGSNARNSQRHKNISASAHALGTAISDDCDSFDTDIDETYEDHMLKQQHNDSGVDMRNVKLPDPPQSTNQVYAIVRKFKNFISNKKSPGSKQHGSQQKLYENSSQFYVEGNVYENTPKASKAKGLKSTKKLPQIPTTSPTANSDDIYENTEFHSPPTIEAVAKQLSTSEKNLSLHGSNAELIQSATSAATLRPKSKATKSFKSRIRKSLGGTTYDDKQLSPLTPTRSTFYIDEPSNNGGSGELDSGFSEKASSGDLPVPTEDAQKFCTAARKAKKEAKTANSQRRRTTIGIRPHDPPPPPPDDGNSVRLKPPQVGGGATSWYAECGVFKNGSVNGVPHDQQSLGGTKSIYSHNGSMITNGTSWYAEAGLYQTSGISVASSSGSSGVSTGNEAGMGDDLPHSMFLNEPLYQIYSAAKLESISRDMEEQDGSTDGYEEVGQHRTNDVMNGEDGQQRRVRPTALHLVGQKSGPSRTLWSEIPEVINSCILPTLTPRERALQEAKFEIVTSEASYLKSLNLLRSHFMNHSAFRDTKVLSARDRKALFSYIVPVHECSERLLTALESSWQESIMLLGLSKCIYSVAEKYFHVYIAFCEHQGRMDRTLRRLKDAKGAFAQNLELLEASPTCCGLNLHSFLMLPMQRITRLPLLIDAVFSKVHPNDSEYDNWKMTLAIMNKVVTQCNEAANRCEQAYEIERISRQLEFPSSIRALAIAPVGVPAPGSKPRFLVKKGELVHLIWRGEDGKLTFGKKFIKVTIFAFLFSDLLVLTKRKGDGVFTVFDYCPRNMLTLNSGDALPQLPTKDINQTGKNLILMTLLENHERKTVELVLSCPSVSEQERWLQAMQPPEPELLGEKLYEQWDCPQVIAKHTYEAKEPDALNLEVGDVVNVSRKLPDGWYQGERIRDGVIGWFPGSFTEEVNSVHVRARNLKQRHRLLTFTATYLESQKRK